MHYTKLLIWQKAMDMAKIAYELTKLFPKEELYSLTSQARRAAISIASNIAEGSQRTSNKEFANFILIAKGSLAELETQLLLARNLGYLSQGDLEPTMLLGEELHKMMHAFHSRLVTRDS